MEAKPSPFALPLRDPTQVQSLGVGGLQLNNGLGRTETTVLSLLMSVQTPPTTDSTRHIALCPTHISSGLRAPADRGCGSLASNSTDNASPVAHLASARKVRLVPICGLQRSALHLERLDGVFHANLECTHPS